MNLRILLVLIGLNVGLAYRGCSQLETTHWFFGNGAGISFYSGNPQVVANSQLGSPGGCTAISDTTGELLCYSNGYQVWNKHHQLLTNGTAIGGDPSAAQPALLIPKPNSHNELYLFLNQRTGGNFSVASVDLAANNGQGAVVSKRTLAQDMTEKLTAILHPDKKSYWILAHRWHSAKFILCRLTQAGLVSIDSQAVGAIHTGVAKNGSGVAKFSPAGDYIILTRPYDDAVDVFDFNAATGAISFRRTITSIRNPYGLAFSPDGNLVYVSGYYYAQGGTRVNQLFQLALPAGTPTVIGSYSDPTFYPEFPAGDMQLGLDGKIYLAIDGQFSLDVIHKPTIVGAGCRYQHQAFLLGSYMGRLGLPNFVQSWLIPKAANFTFKNPACANSPVLFKFKSNVIPQNIQWQFPDNQILYGDSVTYSFADTGQFSVKLVVILAGGAQDSIIKKIVILPAPQNPFLPYYTVCQGESIVLDAGNQYASYYWSNGYTNRQITVTMPGKYSVWVRYGGGACQEMFSANVQHVEPPAPDLGNDTALCDIGSLQLRTGVASQHYRWSNGSQDSAITVHQSGEFWVEVCSGNCCRQDTIRVRFLETPNITLPDTVFLCAESGETQLLQAPAGHHYLWQPGNVTTSWFLLNRTGLCTLTAWNDSSCSVTDTVFTLSNCQYIWIPTAFSPNGDGKNDFFQVVSQNITQFELNLFAKSGQLIFSTTNPNFTWDGENYPENSYYYIVRYRQNFSPEEHFKAGFVVLIR